MRIEADVDRCAGHTLCNAECPEVFGLDDEGQVVILITGEIPAELEKRARLGVSACPERALRVVEA